MDLQLIQRLTHYFSDLKAADRPELAALYAQEIVFKDPIHTVNGLAALQGYFDGFDKNLEAGGFVFHRQDVVGEVCYLQWTMTVQVRRPKRVITLEGLSLLEGTDRVRAHTDYFDLGVMVYEQVPVLGGLVRFIKGKMAG